MKNSAFVLRRLSTILAIAVLTLTLTAGFTGILLAFYYQPTAGGAYESLQTVTTEVPYGWLVRTVHDIAGNWVIGVALIQMVVMFLGARFRRSWLTAWISGILFILSAIGLGWTAIILDWSQIGFWRLRVELSILESIPFIGSTIREVLTGGNGISSVTVAHMYTLHSYVLSLGAVGLAIVHLGWLLLQEREIAQIPQTSPQTESVPQVEAAPQTVDERNTAAA
jgi:cytochrome b6